MQNILVVAEVFERSLRRTTLSAIRFAHEVSVKTGGGYDILVLGEGAEAAAKQASTYGARAVKWAEIEGGYVCERYAPTVAAVANDAGYRVVVATASTFGKDLMPRVAAKIEAGFAPDIAAVEVSGDTLTYKRAMYAGNMFGFLSIKTPKQVVTVRQTEFDAMASVDASSPLEAVTPQQEAVQDKLTFLSMETVKNERPDLAEADVVVAGGRSLKSAENFQTLIEPLADLLGGAMGASRAACDAGYVPNDLQVGQTGKVVAPKLYIAVGISGAIQHLAGMKGSKVVVAINKDKEAPIAQVADYFLVADLFQAMPSLIEEVRKLKAQG